MTQTTLGQRLSRTRKAAGITARELSDAVGGGMSRDVITNIENGRKTDLTVGQLVAIARVLDVPPVSIAFDESETDDIALFLRPVTPRSDAGLEERLERMIDLLEAAQAAAGGRQFANPSDGLIREALREGRNG